MNERDDRSATRQLLWRAACYFGLVFAAGFALGVARVLLLVPRFGERTAELLEAPLMAFIIVTAARFVTRRFPARRPRELLYSGLLALALVLVLEFTVVLGLRGLTLSEYLAGRDPLAGAVYLLLLGLFALMPLWQGRRGAQR